MPFISVVIVVIELFKIIFIKHSLVAYLNIEMINISYYSEQAYKEQYNRTIKTNKSL